MSNPQKLLLISILVVQVTHYVGGNICGLKNL